MQEPLQQRGVCQERTLESIKECNRQFIASGAQKNKAKDVSKNIYSQPILDIPISQVGLHSI